MCPYVVVKLPVWALLAYISTLAVDLEEQAPYMLGQVLYHRGVTLTFLGNCQIMKILDVISIPLWPVKICTNYTHCVNTNKQKLPFPSNLQIKSSLMFVNVHERIPLTGSIVGE